jgi:murein DD-endopeptidase MepM/ murein hydrolase activator NlpD
LLFAWLRTEKKAHAQWLNHEVVHGMVVAVLGLLVVSQMRTMLRIDLVDQASHIQNRRTQTEELRQIEALVAGVPGRVLLTEQMNLLPQNGKSIYLQPFEMTQLYYDGTWDQYDFVREIEQQQFDLILMHQWDGERWTGAMRRAMWNNYTAAHYLADTIVYLPAGDGPPASAVLDCQPESGWTAPTGGSMGALWYAQQAFIASGLPWGKTPVYAVADGRLYRFPGWSGAVAIQHPDPFDEDQFVWSYYGLMRNPWNASDQYVLDKFTPSFSGYPVRQGDLIGYQGAVDLPGTALTSRLHFAVVPGDKDGFFPVAWWELPGNPDAYLPDLEGFDPLALRETGLYLGIEASPSRGREVYWHPFRCVAAQEGN